MEDMILKVAGKSPPWLANFLRAFAPFVTLTFTIANIVGPVVVRFYALLYKVRARACQVFEHRFCASTVGVRNNGPDLSTRFARIQVFGRRCRASLVGVWCRRCNGPDLSTNVCAKVSWPLNAVDDNRMHAMLTTPAIVCDSSICTPKCRMAAYAFFIGIFSATPRPSIIPSVNSFPIGGLPLCSPSWVYSEELESLLVAGFRVRLTISCNTHALLVCDHGRRPSRQMDQYRY